MITSFECDRCGRTIKGTTAEMICHRLPKT